MALNFHFDDDDEEFTPPTFQKENDEHSNSDSSSDAASTDIPSHDMVGSVGVEKAEPEPLSDAQVDEQFDDLVSAWENDEAVIAASSALMEAEHVIAKVEKEREEARVEYDEVSAERQALEKQLNAIIAKQSALRDKAVVNRHDATEAQRKKQDAERAVSLAKQAVQVRYDGARKAATFSTLAQGKAWFEGTTRTGERILEHQWTGCQFLATSHRAILGDGMGLGKTLTTIAALDLLESKRTLIVAQNDITTNFDTEVRKWAPHRSVVNIRGMAKAQRDQLLSLGTFMKDLTVIVNYEAWRRDSILIERLISMGFDSVILDEAHNIKGTDTNAYMGVNQVIKANNLCPIDGVTLPEMVDVRGNPVGRQRMCVKCGWAGQAWADDDMERDERFYHTKSVKNVFCVTGTPILNKPQDLFALLSLVDPINFNVKSHFLNEYCEQDYYTGQWKFRSGGAQYLMKHQLKGRYLARNYEDAGIVLPPQEAIVHTISMDEHQYPKQTDVIRQLTNHAQLVMSDGATLSAIAKIALITRQRQANVWAGGIQWTVTDPLTGDERIVRVSEEIDESIKIDKAIQIIKEAMENGHRIVLFSQFKMALKELFARLDGKMLDNGQVIRAVRFDGDTPDNIRTQVKTNFDKKMGEEAKWDVLLAHYKVGGTGLNLTAAQTTIILDEEWNPGKRDQAYARTNRIGQTENTFVHVLRLERTVDTWLSKLIDNKAAVIGGFDEAALDMQQEWLSGFQSGEFNI